MGAFLASCPEHLLSEAIEVADEYAIPVAAGDRSDFFNSKLLVHESWKTGMKGKLYAVCSYLGTVHQGQEIIAITIAGGVACEWERNLLNPIEVNSDSLRQHFGNLRLKVCSSAPDMKKFLQRGAPLDEAI